MTDALPSERGPGVGPLGQSPQSRWLVIQQPPALPGSCFLCLGSYSPDAPVERKWFVDTQIQADFHGAVYVCNLCLYEMASVAGWLTPIEAMAVKDEIDGLRKENYHLSLRIAALAEMENAAHAYLQHRSPDALQLPFGSPGQLVLLPGDGEASSIDGAGEGGSQGATDQLGAGTGTAPESSDGEGVDDVRPNDQLDVPGGGFYLPRDE